MTGEASKEEEETERTRRERRLATVCQPPLNALQDGLEPTTP